MHKKYSKIFERLIMFSLNIFIRTLRWYGHLLRMPPDTPARTIFDFDPVLHGGKRPRGRPPTRWKDTTGAFLVTANIQEDVRILARDRSKWRHHVASLSTLEAFRRSIKSSKSYSMRLWRMKKKFKSYVKHSDFSRLATTVQS